MSVHPLAVLALPLTLEAFRLVGAHVRPQATVRSRKVKISFHPSVAASTR